jgi:hypothetical protein
MVKNDPGVSASNIHADCLLVIYPGPVPFWFGGDPRLSHKAQGDPLFAIIFVFPPLSGDQVQPGLRIPDDQGVFLWNRLAAFCELRPEGFECNHAEHL